MSVPLHKGDVVLVYTSAYGGKQGIGLIKYIGNMQNDLMKEYVGIELIEPIEHGHNGSVDNIQYFSCHDSYGIHAPITNVIKILSSREIMLKLQEVILMFKNKLSQYIQALNQRDSYISDLTATQSKLKTLLTAATNNNPNTNTQRSLSNFSNNSAHFQPQTAPLTPIADSNTIHKRKQLSHNNISYEQMMHNVDHAITAQSLAIKLDAKRVNNEYMRYQTPLTHKSTKSSNNYSPITQTNTLDSGTPSSRTPAPNAIKNALKSPSATTNKTMLIHEDDGEDRIGALDISETVTTEEPDPLMTPTMDPISEVHSFNGMHMIRHNTMETRSPSQPRLFKTESGPAISTLSGNSPQTPTYGGNITYYPEYDDINNEDHSTSSYLSATSSTFITPKSTTATANNINPHGLLTTWNSRKLSKQSTRSRSDKDQLQLSDGGRNKSQSRSRSKKKHVHAQKKQVNANKNVPHIYSGANTPALSADNDAVLSGHDGFPRPPPKSRRSRGKKRRKSKELKITSNLPEFTPSTQQMRNRSASAIFTPSQLESAAKYSFKTIQEEPQSQSQLDAPADSPRFASHHSTPIFHAQSQNIYYPDVRIQPHDLDDDEDSFDDDIDDDFDGLTPELPYGQQVQAPQGRSSLPPQQPVKVLKSRYNPQKQQQRASLPPQDSFNSKHMQASSQINIAVPMFANMRDGHGGHGVHGPVHFSSLQNIHEHGHGHGHGVKPGQTVYHQSAPQLDHWVDHQQMQQIHQQQMYMQQQHMQQQQMQQQQMQMQQRPISAHQHAYQIQNIDEPQPPQQPPYTLPLMNSKAKSMPASVSFHIPSQQSIDMNPYIDEQFLDQQFMFQPQTIDVGPHGVSPLGSGHGMIGAVPVPPPHGANTIYYQQHSHTPHSDSLHSHSPLQSHPIPPAIMTNMSQVNPPKIGKVQFAPRKNIHKQLRRMSKNSKNNPNKSQVLNTNNNRNHNSHKVQRVPQSQSMQHPQQQKHKHSQQIYQNPQNMAGFTLTDAMYD